MENHETDLTVEEVDSNIVDTAENIAPAECTAPEPSLAYSEEEIQKLVEQARTEGYLRGKNEKIEEWLQTTAPDSDDLPDPDIADNSSYPGFLAHLRPGFWD